MDIIEKCRSYIEIYMSAMDKINDYEKNILDGTVTDKGLEDIIDGVRNATNALKKILEILEEVEKDESHDRDLVKTMREQVVEAMRKLGTRISGNLFFSFLTKEE